MEHRPRGVWHIYTVAHGTAVPHGSFLRANAIQYQVVSNFSIRLKRPPPPSRSHRRRAQPFVDTARGIKPHVGHYSTSFSVARFYGVADLVKPLLLLWIPYCCGYVAWEQGTLVGPAGG